MDKPEGENTCALCKKIHTGKTTSEWVFLRFNGELDGWHYSPALTEDEMTRLEYGFSSVCKSRKQCRQRQLKNK